MDAPEPPNGAPSRVDQLLRASRRWLLVVIHFFLSLLGLLLLLVAVIGAVDMMIFEFPKLLDGAQWNAMLHRLVTDILLIAIACELAQLLLLRQTSAVIEIIILVVARKMVTPELSAPDLLVGTVSLAVLMVLEVYLSRRKSTGPGY